MKHKTLKIYLGIYIGMRMYVFVCLFVCDTWQLVVGSKRDFSTNFPSADAVQSHSDTTTTSCPQCALIEANETDLDPVRPVRESC